MSVVYYWSFLKRVVHPHTKPTSLHPVYCKEYSKASIFYASCPLLLLGDVLVLLVIHKAVGSGKAGKALPDFSSLTKIFIL